jgi:DNA-binding transcriptional regulator YbjK
MTSRRDELLDAAIELLGERGVRGVTHRAVDAAAGRSAGSASNYFRTSDALLIAVIERFADRERAALDDLAAGLRPSGPAEVAELFAAAARASAGPGRVLTLARYAILLESAQRPALRERLAETGGRVNMWAAEWLKAAGSADPERDAPIVQNYLVGLVLHQLARPRPGFDPGPPVAALVTALVGSGHGEG